MRVPNEEYFKWLELAAKNRQAISTYMKSCINTHIGVLYASNGIKLESSPVAKTDTNLISKINKLEILLEQKDKDLKDSLNEIDRLNMVLKEGKIGVQKLNTQIHIKEDKIEKLEKDLSEKILEKDRLIEKLRDDIQNTWDNYVPDLKMPLWQRRRPSSWDSTIMINGLFLDVIWQRKREEARMNKEKQFTMRLPCGLSIIFNTINGKSITT